MNSKNTNRLTAVMVAALLTVVTNGSMLLKFDTVANNAAMAHSGQAPAVVTLDIVTIVARRA
ncbi:MAG: hypothetical protein V4858_05905 [Pseudomonadota bacterium]